MIGRRFMKDRKKLRLLKAVLLVITIACLLPVGQSCCLSIQHEKQQREFKNIIDRENESETAEEGVRSAKGGIAGSEADGAVILPELAELYARNNDLVGWLTVEGTKIDYPVMQCGDDEYYLYHNFDKEEDKYGCLFVKSIADIHTPGTNVIIYGHHMKDDSMFGDLDRYASEEFYRQHGQIFFDTLYETRTYEVMAVFLTQVSAKEDDSGFQYYKFYQADTEEEFEDFYENVKEMSAYDTGLTAEFGDTFLTLSTCSGFAENGRFVVVAKRVDTDEK